MRPVNLIPLEDRRGEKAPLRTGPLAYAIVAGLALAVLATTLVILTNNQISDREAEKASLSAQVDQAQAEAKKLDPFVRFSALQEARQDTVNGLATSRFDWERVLRELAIVIPSDVWLTNLDAKASPTATTAASSSGAASSATESVLGPSLDIQGCASGHDAVARFLASLRDVDGVTRASVLSSDRQGDTATAGGTSSGSTGAGGIACASRNFISSFEIVIAFDEAQPAAPADSSSTATTAPSTSTTTTTTPPPATDSTSAGTEQAQASTADGQGGTDKNGQGQDGGAFVPGTGSAP